MACLFNCFASLDGDNNGHAEQCLYKVGGQVQTSRLFLSFIDYDSGWYFALSLVLFSFTNAILIYEHSR